MNLNKKFAVMLCCAAIAAGAVAQTESQLKRAAQGKTGASPDEVVSFKSDVPYTEAVKSLGELWKKFAGKIVIDRSSLKTSEKQIGVNIQVMYWKDAFDLILRQNGLWYNQFDEHVEIVSVGEVQAAAAQQSVTGATPAGAQISDVGGQQAVAKVDSGEYYAGQREITISSVFLEIDRTKLAQSGISFSIFRGRGLNLGIEFTGANNISTPILGATLNPSDPRLAVDVSAALAIFESEQLGNVLARPQITVRSGSFARLQSGTDFSTKTRDFSQNLVETFYHTGTILNVSPKYFKYNDLEFVTLNYKIERSSPTIGDVSTIISITDASGALSLLNGEESFVGGLYSNQETVTREGIPLLKDLPWWVFGLRYLFGYDATSVSKKELIVLMKAELVPTLETRAADKSTPAKNILQDKIKEFEKDRQKRNVKKD